MAFLIIIGFFAILVIWAIAIYNSLVKKRNLMMEGWSGIDVQLKRRSDLVPNLVETVKGYAAHEEGVFKKVVALRNSAVAATKTGERAIIENELSGMLRQVFALAENYPDLKANENFSQLQGQLAAIEEQLQLARRYYNGTARELNVLVQSIPSNFIAQAGGFSEADYFEIELATERQTPEVRF